MPLIAVYLPVIYGALRIPHPLFHAMVLTAAVGLGLWKGFASFEYLRYCLNGFVFAYGFAVPLRKNAPLFWVLILALVPEFLFLVLCDLVPEYGQVFSGLIAEASQRVDQALGGGTSQPVPLELLVPAAEFFKHLATTLLLCFAFGRLAGRERPKMSDLRVPAGFAWVLALGLGCTLLEWPGRVGFYLLFISALFYLLNGVSVVRLFFEKANRGRWTEFFFYVVQPGLFFIPVFSIGILDTWWRFRDRIDAWHKGQGKPPEERDNDLE